ncbi:probable DNA metabolism protein [Muriicola jejuensis]|uniref:DUF4130 domain-containing protein n=1 Tax=Muriicola jejuensis TaxID=504488 RepID=A0A6P0UDN0_9FLAO|nr:DUF4130 domain-containing protein [Muriicola jejuensis]NER11364.1 DUF4130 domain-containing protein [Muriicola jejuensis]SMP21150.1 probable DNA metabolism protein [Muriicola jejuensis]
MENEKAIYFYDGSFNGFLTILYSVEHEGLQVEEICKIESPQDALFPEPRFIDTCQRHAQQLWEHLRAENYSALKTLYFAFMSNEKVLEGELLRFFLIWRKYRSLEKNIMFSSDFVRLFKLAREVEKEKDHMERRLSVQLDPGAPPVRLIRPKHNILPLISKRLRMRYRHSEWYVFDVRRKYGLHHLDGNISFIPFRSEYLKEDFMQSGYQGDSGLRFILEEVQNQRAIAHA